MECYSAISLLQGIFSTQGLNPGLPHCRRILYCLSYQGSPRILEWAACPFSRGSSWPRNQTGVSCIAGGFFTSGATREALNKVCILVLVSYLNGKILWKWEWKWRSLYSTLCDCTVHGILQARLLKWVAFAVSRGSSQPRDWTQVSRIAGRFFTNWATREAQEYWSG